MKKIKVLKTKEFSAINEGAVNKIRINEYDNEILSIRTEASEGVTQSHMIIVLPSGMVDAKELDNSVSEILCDTKGGAVFSVGKYLSGRYLSGGVRWDDGSLCVSLRGAVCDANTAMSVAVDIMVKHNLPRILLVSSLTIIEIIHEQARPQHRIRQFAKVR